MDTQTSDTGDLCHRCLVPVPRDSARCPRCGETVHKAGSYRKAIAVFGLLMFLIIAAVAFRMMQTGGGLSSAPKDNTPVEQKPALGQ
jgi:uncharacterized paraquat-inducible protein A